jgi:glycoprotein-N-acetylgalactosamine 3-beta-galactosyltransferase
LNTCKQNYFQSKVRIYCFILTAPKYFDTRARAVNLTWAPRCDGYSFISEYSNDTKGLPIAPIANITPGYGHLTQKSTLALHYIYEHFLNDYEWFIKADDDTYLFVEHLKLFLKDKNPSDPITYGYNFKVDISKNIDETIFLFA